MTDYLSNALNVLGAHADIVFQRRATNKHLVHRLDRCPEWRVQPCDPAAGDIACRHPNLLCLGVLL